MTEDGGDLTGYHREGRDQPLRVPVDENTVDGDQLVAAVRDVLERGGAEEELHTLHDVVLGLLSATTGKQVGRLAVDAADDLGYPVSVMWEHRSGEQGDRLLPVAATEPIRVDECEPLDGGTPSMEAFRDGEAAVIDLSRGLEAAGVPARLGPVILAPVGGHGLLWFGRREAMQVEPANRPLIDALVRAVETTLDRIEHEHRLERRTWIIESLQDAMRRMVRADDEQEICEIAVETAKGVLGLPLASIWLQDESGRELRPVAWGEAAEDLFDELPVYTEGNSLSWRAFETGETLVLDDVRAEADVHDPDTPIRSEIVLPIGEYGVLNSGSTELETFDESDAALANLLAENTAVALERAERERALKRQTDRMEFFNSILRHAVLNGMTVIRSRADVLVDGVDHGLTEEAETIVKRCDAVVEIVQRVHTLLDTLTAEDGRTLHPVDLSATIEEEVDRVRSAHPDVAFEVDVPPGVTVEADELLGDVLGNLVTNAVDHNDTGSLRVAVSVEAGPETVTVRVADNGQGVPDERKESVFRRDDTGHAKTTGSGFGLFFVDTMVTAYGGEIWVEDNDAGGATFVVEFVRSDAESRTERQERS